MLGEVGHRYQLIERLGQGGMGVVYKARDRLHNQMVALKRVTVSSDRLQFAERTRDTFSPKLALAREFRTLSSLRHPHIISVLDYGFDGQQMPYFTMELLDDATDFLTALQDATLDERLELTIQMLHALAYLHRRGLLHRDLKPENVLVITGKTKQVKLLDFGVANDVADLGGKQTSIVGTFNYMAPEIFKGQPPSIASDLYAVGVMLYELFHGKYPFAYQNVSQLLSLVIEAIPQVTKPDDLPALRNSIERLLSKYPEDRYADAMYLIRLYATLIEQPELADSHAVRESFLQAAAFIGRERELSILELALDCIFNSQPQGKAFLIGGESGVGKSRLVEELRTLALVKGARVLKGEGVEGGGLPYQLWRPVVRRLILSTGITDTEASILKEVVPDISALIGRDVGTAQELTGDAAVERLSLTIVDLLRRQTEPMVLILSDLHWTRTSLQPLKYLLPFVADLPLLIIGSYRTDEQPDLPETLSEMQVIHLQRLSEAEIEQLSTSMLGQSAPDSVVNFIHRHSEGNALFIIEVVRALAEHAGKLEDIGRLTLPASIVTGGIEAIIQRRIERVGPVNVEPLKLAAVAGRVVDTDVMEAAMGQPLAATFFQVCSEASVLEMHEERWRFTHSKLRDALLKSLSTEELQQMHARIANAIELVYAGDEAHAHILSQHYLVAGDIQKSAEYGLIAARQMVETSEYREAIDLLQQVLRAIQQDPQANDYRIEVTCELGYCYEHLSSYDVARTYFTDSLELARASNNRRYIARNITGLGILDYNQSDHKGALIRLDEALTLARAINDRQQVALCLKHRSNAYSMMSNYRQSDADLHEAIEICRAENMKNELAGCLNNVGVNAYLRGDYGKAKDYYKQAHTLYTEVGYRSGIALCESNLADVSYDEGDNAQLIHYRRGLAIYREVGNQWGIALCLDNMGSTQMVMGEYDAANASFDESLGISRKIGDRYGEMYVLGNLAMLEHIRIQHNNTLSYASQALAIANELDDNEARATYLTQLALSQIQLGLVSDAHNSLYHACQRADQAEAEPTTLLVLTGILHSLHSQGKMALASELLAFLMQQDQLENTVRRLFILPMKDKISLDASATGIGTLDEAWERFRLKSESLADEPGRSQGAANYENGEG